MFSFHKPRVYRSADGCCICRAKSSSSRFTASRKYEKESVLCFNLQEPRNGEICNACVLLVKRFKRLPADSKRHWGHVVDARAGPGTKSLAKQKKRENAEAGEGGVGGSSSFIPEKFAKIFKKNRKGKITAVPGAVAEPVARNHPRQSSSSPMSEHQQSDSNESNDEEHLPVPASVTVTATATATGGGAPPILSAPYQTRKRTAAASAAQAEQGKNSKRPKLTGSKRRCQLAPKKNRRAVDNVPFFEESDLIRLEVCCGTVFQSLTLGMCCYIIDPMLYKPCEKHQRLRRQQAEMAATAAAAAAANAKPKMVPPVAAAASGAAPVAIPAPSQNQTPNQGNIVQNPMPAMKKHHLFFKRQSESFPQGDIHRISPIPLNKTEVTAMALPHSTTATATASLHPGMTTTSVGAASPSSLSSSSNCSTSSSVATKFNDNSSDSGFDEHVLERKLSVSPPTDELKQRGATAGGMQLILASGLPITGQTQNLVLAGNEFTARIVQQRQQPSEVVVAPGAALKINVVGGSQGNSNKIRAIFNNANTIQHENGVTTILPASSLAASNQTAAMNAIAPSTVTITPAKKGAATTTTTATVAVAATNANPKFILLKSAKFVGQAVPANTPSSAETKV
ncbi:uncharacterized protein [Drosophila pseudoobscura]|uniref:Protein FAM60A n=1 Tax=Drosophila pseudoobscura pseudoobscura TaxID=46245 RepID=A0A6I8VI08_DROPS|nr:uncharacterized protein LOC4815219 [Drosophila pseudoobscura]XP_015041774.2 uncharacterized protein LOC4815219 [Drosophila pseudoobscura]